MTRMTAELVATLTDRVSAQARAIERSLDRMEHAQTRSTRGIERGTGATRGMTGALGMMARSAAEAAMPLAAGLGAVEVVKTAAQFETALSAIQKKGGLTSEALAKVKTEILDIVESGKIAADPKEIASAYERGIAAGLPMEELKQFAMLSTKAADSFDMASADVGNAAAGFKVGLGIPIAEMERYFDLINGLADSGISDEKDIISFLDRAGASLKQYGLSAQEAAAYGSSVLNLKMAPDVGANAFSTLTGALLAPSSKKARAALSGIVGDLGDFNKLQKKDPNAAVLKFFDSLNKLDKFEATELLQGFVGAGFDDEILRMANGIAEMRKNLDFAGGTSWFGSLDKSYGLKLKTMESQWKVFTANLQKLAIDMGDLILAPASGFLADATSAVNEFSAAIKGAQTTYDTLKSAMTGNAPRGDFDTKSITDNIPAMFNRRRLEAELHAKETESALVSKSPGSGAAGAIGARSMDGQTAGGVLAYMRNTIRRFKGETVGGRRELEAQQTHWRNTIAGVRASNGETNAAANMEAERKAALKRKADFLAARGVDAPPDPEAPPAPVVRPPSNDLGRRTGNFATPTPRPDVRASVAPTPRPSRAEDTVAASQAQPVAPPAPPPRSTVNPYASTPVVTAAPFAAPAPAPAPAVGISPAQSEIKDIDQALAGLADKKRQLEGAFRLAPSPESITTMRQIGDEMQRLMERRDALDAEMQKPFAMVTPSIEAPLRAEGDRARMAAAEAGNAILTALSITARPTIDSSGIDALISKVRTAQSELASLANSARSARDSMVSARADYSGLHADTTRAG